MLIDSLISEKSSSQFSKQLLCVSAILFVIKLERDYNDNLYDFFRFLGAKLKIRPEDIYKCECYILSTIPDHFGLLVGFTELLKSFVCILELPAVPDTELEFMSNVAIDMYVKAETKLSIDSLLVMLVMKAYFPKKTQEQKKQKLMSHLKVCRDKERMNKDIVDLTNYRTIRVFGGGLVSSWLFNLRGFDWCYDPDIIFAFIRAIYYSPFDFDIWKKFQ